jgi:hypothetical protein
LYDLVKVGGEEDFIRIESDTHQVCRIVPKAFEVLNTVVTAHIPSDMVGVPHYNLGYCRSPATAANDGYLTALVHILLLLLAISD